MVKTLVEKITSPRPGVTIFKISGTLGFHENEVLTKFFSECSRRGIYKLVMDFSSLTSLGGGCARILRDAADSGGVVLCIAGASRTIRQFLTRGGGDAIRFEPDVETSIAYVDRFEPPNTGAEPNREGPVDASTSPAPSTAQGMPANSTAPAPDVPPAKPDADAPRLRDAHAAPRFCDVPPDVASERAVDGTDDRTPKIAPARPDPSDERSVSERHVTDGSGRLRDAGEENDAIILEQPVAALADEAEDPPQEATIIPPEGSSGEGSSSPRPPSPAPEAEPGPPVHNESSSADLQESELKRRIVQYKALFSLNSDFSRILDKGRLLDAFLLSTIAQVGVESAAFLEYNDEAFTAVAWKGFETADPTALRIEQHEVNLDEWMTDPVVFPIEEAPLAPDARARLSKWDLPFAAPFLVYGRCRAVVLLGRPIREHVADDTWHFMGILINQAAVAYENACRFEAESERTLGLVHSLITMIEENTMSRGNTEAIVDYVQAVGTAMHYPEEHMRDLIYGTVLRDIGMIKVSDLIVRSPRELAKEEWEIIKRHPVEGADMLSRMSFSEHTQDVVRSHHERFNGEGYPGGMQGPQIPLGARIVAVVESYVAMINDRPTRPALTQEEALATLRENWGMRYDPDVVSCFTDIVEDEIRSGRKVRFKQTDHLRLGSRKDS